MRRSRGAPPNISSRPSGKVGSSSALPLPLVVPCSEISSRWTHKSQSRSVRFSSRYQQLPQCLCRPGPRARQERACRAHAIHQFDPCPVCVIYSSLRLRYSGVWVLLSRAVECVRVRVASGSLSTQRISRRPLNASRIAPHTHRITRRPPTPLDAQHSTPSPHCTCGMRRAAIEKTTRSFVTVKAAAPPSEAADVLPSKRGAHGAARNPTQLNPSVPALY